ncbi:MAG TPA: acyl carrier protein [Pseudonocardiaceae bacterium]|nr:acyl carrier protein [Pseudonocardiaceae bacterium]
MAWFGNKKKAPQVTGALTEATLRQWLVEHLATLVDVPVTEIDTTKSFEAYGLDSRVAVRVSGQLERLVERRLSPGLLFEHENVDELSTFLARELELTGQEGG